MTIGPSIIVWGMRSCALQLGLASVEVWARECGGAQLCARRICNEVSGVSRDAAFAPVLAGPGAAAATTRGGAAGRTAPRFSRDRSPAWQLAGQKCGRIASTG